jgi:hypothetical protein
VGSPTAAIAVIFLGDVWRSDYRDPEDRRASASLATLMGASGSCERQPALQLRRSYINETTRSARPSEIRPSLAAASLICVLLDVCTPVQVRQALPDHEIRTAVKMGWG